MLVEFTSKFLLKFLLVAGSLQSLIRKHSYLDHRYLRWSATFSWVLAPGSCPGLGMEVEMEVYFLYESVLKTVYSHSCQRHGSILWHWLEGHEINLSMTYMLCVSDFALYLVDWCMNMIAWDIESVWLDVWPQNKSRLQWHMIRNSAGRGYTCPTGHLF